MPLKTIVFVALRLYALYWLVESAATWMMAVPVLMALQSETKHIPLYSYFLPPSAMILLSIALWLGASKLSTLVTRGHDAPVTFASLTKSDLYAFAFVFLGLFFVLSSTASTFQAAYKFFAYDFSLPEGDPGRGKFLIPLLGQLITFLGGFACILGANKWARKLDSPEK